MKKHVTLFFLLSLGMWISGQSQTWKVEDVIHQQRVSGVDIAPEGDAVVWTTSRPDKKQDKFVSDVWMTLLNATDEKGNFKTIQLTRSKDSDRSPVFSLDGTLIYFLSSRKKGKALWALNRLGGSPYVVDSFQSSISMLHVWNEETLCFVAEEGKTLYEQEAQKKKDNTVVVEDVDHFKPSRVFSYNLKTKKLKRLTDNRYPISEYACSKDGKWLVTRHTLSPHYPADGKPAPKYYLWNIETGEKEEILSQGFQTPGSFAFAGDSKGFYFTSEQSSDPEWQGAGINILHYFDLAQKRVNQVPLDWDWGLTRSFVIKGNDVLATLANGTSLSLAYYERVGETDWKKWEVDAGAYQDHLNLMKLSTDGKQLVANHSDASTPVAYSLFTVEKNTGNISLTEGGAIAALNKGLEKKAKTRSQVVTWKGALGDEVTGILFYPTQYQAGRAYPLMLSIHGGPAGVDMDLWGDRWSTYPHLLAEKGMFVLKPNYHGSSNHGQAFVESIKKHYYEYELPDILAGVDSLVSAGLVDNDSLGVMGWSNGAILATMLTVQHPDRFKVCAAGAGDVNWTSDFGTCRFGVTFDQSYFGGAPWDNVGGKTYNEAYILKSPLFEMEKVKTPTIIFHGSEDRAVPRDQGWEYYRSLQQLDQTPVRFLWFPGQRHGLAKLTHQARKMKEEIRWIEKHLLGKENKENEAFKEGSPLALLLKQESHAHQSGQWGRLHKGKLIPEVVVAHADSIAIGRYELTQAQYKAFNPSYSIESGKENYPVVGLSLEQVRFYLTWLSDLTGKIYRLPNASEATALHKLALKQAGKSNSLSHWAGYALTWDDAQLLRNKLEEVQGTLMKPVGSFPSSKVGKAELYDLYGNAAECYLKEGKMHTYGGSVYDFPDKASDSIASKPAHTGLRVVREEK